MDVFTVRLLVEYFELSPDLILYIVDIGELTVVGNIDFQEAELLLAFVA